MTCKLDFRGSISLGRNRKVIGSIEAEKGEGVGLSKIKTSSEFKLSSLNSGHEDDSYFLSELSLTTLFDSRISSIPETHLWRLGQNLSGLNRPRVSALTTLISDSEDT